MSDNKLKDGINQKRNSIRWTLLIRLVPILLICQVITVLLLWHESKEQIDVLVNLTLNQQISDELIRHEEMEAILILIASTVVILVIAIILTYFVVKKIVKPLESIERDLKERTGKNLQPIYSSSQLIEIKSITGALNTLFYRLDETLQQERLFTADVAHELRTPLAGIRLHLELLERTQNISCSELIERIDRLVNTIEQLLSLARSSQKFITSEVGNIDFNVDIINSLAGELQSMLESKKQTLIWSVANKTPIFNADAVLVSVLLRNLVENASRYSPEQTKIEVNYEEIDDKSIMLSVKDEGIGLDESKISLLSDAFFRMDRRHKGIGLGLSIVNRIIKLHQGELILQNRTDRASGTIILCKLPKKING